jgi:hypothetical protein
MIVPVLSASREIWIEDVGEYTHPHGHDLVAFRPASDIRHTRFEARLKKNALVRFA